MKETAKLCLMMQFENDRIEINKITDGPTDI